MDSLAGAAGAQPSPRGAALLCRKRKCQCILSECLGGKEAPVVGSRWWQRPRGQEGLEEQVVHGKSQRCHRTAMWVKTTFPFLGVT